MSGGNVTWYKFRCNNCGWETVGAYNWYRDPAMDSCLPDTDCPKCGSHDSVVGGDEEAAAPEDVAAVRQDQNTGPYAK